METIRSKLRHSASYWRQYVQNYGSHTVTGDNTFKTTALTQLLETIRLKLLPSHSYWRQCSKLRPSHSYWRQCSKLQPSHSYWRQCSKLWLPHSYWRQCSKLPLPQSTCSSYLFLTGVDFLLSPQFIYV